MPRDYKAPPLLNRLVLAPHAAASNSKPKAIDYPLASKAEAAVISLLSSGSEHFGNSDLRPTSLKSASNLDFSVSGESKREPKERAVLLFSHERAVFHALDDAFGNLPGYAVTLDWISNEQFSPRSVIEAEYDLFFIDYRFGFRLGVEEQLETLRRISMRSDIPPIVVITAREHLRLTLQALDAGAVDYLFQDELGSALLERMLRYAGRGVTKRSNRLYERRAAPTRDKITAPLLDAVEEPDSVSAPGVQTPTRGLRPVHAGSRRLPTLQPSVGLSVLLNALPHAVYWKHADGTYLACNTRFARLLSAESPEDVVGTNASEWELDSLLSKCEQRTEPCLVSWPQPVSRDQGRRYQFHTTPLNDELNEPIGTIGVLEDVTDYLQTRKALRESELRLRSVMAQLPVEVWTIDSELRLFLSNNSRLKSNIERRFKTPLTLQEYFSISTLDSPALSAAEQALRGESVSFYHLQDGAEYLVQLQPFRNASGVIIGAVGVTVNVSECSSIEDKREQSLKHERITALVRGVAHDFNNLLLGIVGNAGMAALDLDQNIEAYERLQKITRAAQCASDLSEQLLSYAGQLPQEKTSVELSTLAAEVGSILEGSVIQSGTITQAFCSELPAIEADPSQIKQVVMNLLTNAADAVSGSAGKILLRTGIAELAERPGVIRVGSDISAEGAYVYLAVEDTGPGIDQDTQRRIFDPFYTTKVSGRGLGLATVLRIVRNHNGFIEVESRPGKGTAFRVYFPATKV